MSKLERTGNQSGYFGRELGPDNIQTLKEENARLRHQMQFKDKIIKRLAESL